MCFCDTWLATSLGNTRGMLRVRRREGGGKTARPPRCFSPRRVENRCIRFSHTAIALEFYFQVSHLHDLSSSSQHGRVSRRRDVPCFEESFLSCVACSAVLACCPAQHVPSNHHSEHQHFACDSTEFSALTEHTNALTPCGNLPSTLSSKLVNCVLGKKMGMFLFSVTGNRAVGRILPFDFSNIQIMVPLP